MVLDRLGPNTPMDPEGPTGPISDSLAYTTFLALAASDAASATAYVGCSCDRLLLLL